MRGGLLRHRLRYEEAVETRDAMGQPVASWSTVIPLVWGEVRSPRGSEVVAAQAYQATVDRIVSCRAQTREIKPSGRLVDVDRSVDGTTVAYEIVAVMDPDGRSARMVIHAIERAT